MEDSSARARVVLADRIPVGRTDPALMADQVHTGRLALVRSVHVDREADIRVRADRVEDIPGAGVQGDGLRADLPRSGKAYVRPASSNDLRHAFILPKSTKNFASASNAKRRNLVKPRLAQTQLRSRTAVAK